MVLPAISRMTTQEPVKMEVHLASQRESTMSEDSSALNVAEGSNAEKVVGKGRHDTANVCASSGQHW